MVTLHGLGLTCLTQLYSDDTTLNVLRQDTAGKKKKNSFWHSIVFVFNLMERNIQNTLFALYKCVISVTIQMFKVCFLKKIFP